MAQGNLHKGCRHIWLRLSFKKCGNFLGDVTLVTLAVVNIKVWVEVDPNEDIDAQVDAYLSNVLDDYEYIKEK